MILFYLHFFLLSKKQKEMPQIIFNSLDKEIFKTFVIDFKKKDIPQLSWDDIFDIMEKAYLHSKKIFYIIDINGKRKPYKNIHKEKLNLWDYVMYNSTSNEKNNDFYISFGIHISSVNKLKKNIKCL